MKEYVRLIKGEMYKMRHTMLLFIHAAIPAAGIFMFVGYYKISAYGSADEWTLYIQAVAIALPTVIGIICAMSISLEEQNHFQVFYGTAVRKIHAFLAKWGALSFLCFWSVGLAVLGFALCQRIILLNVPDFPMYAESGFVLWLGAVFLYPIHLFISLKWSGNISMCMGVLGSLLSAVMQTGLGDGVWQFFLCSFGGRHCRYLLLYRLGYEEHLKAVYPLRDISVNAAVAVIVCVIICLWFCRQEGRQIND